MFMLIVAATYFAHFFMSARRVDKDGIAWGVIGVIAFLVPAAIVEIIARYFYINYGIHYERGELWLIVTIFAGRMAGILIAFFVRRAYLTETPLKSDSLGEADSLARALKQFVRHESVTETCVRCGSLITVAAVAQATSDASATVRIECKHGCINGTYRMPEDKQIRRIGPGEA